MNKKFVVRWMPTFPIERNPNAVSFSEMPQWKQNAIKFGKREFMPSCFPKDASWEYGPGAMNPIGRVIIIRHESFDDFGGDPFSLIGEQYKGAEYPKVLEECFPNER